ncbi:MAG: MarR family transcriptional regulator [Lachnospiraceae bacterium]|nr:MarR family transcriptional regulator [Lachnospiraceae bacterium]
MNEPKLYFKKIHNQLEAGFNKEYKKYGLTSTQLDVLMYLSQETDRECTLSDIAAHFDVKHTSVIHVLKLLEQKGFICKSEIQGARAKPILLTDSGRQLGEQLSSEIRQKSPLLDEIMFAGLSEDDRQLLDKMLEQIYRNLKSDAFRNL